MRKGERLSTVVYDPQQAYLGYTLFTPCASNKVLLIDMNGNVVHSWETPYEPGMHGVLLPNGNLLYAGRLPDTPLPEFGGMGGAIVEYDWDGNEVWHYEDPFQHHDFFRMDNGNTMILSYDAVPDDIAAKAKGGLPGTERKGVIWSSVFREVTPEGEVAWEWVGHEHYDIEEHTMCPLCARAEWDHCNSCEVLPDGNVMTTSFMMNRIMIIEKATGNIIWEWGKNELAHPHNPTILENGHVLVFDNGNHRPLFPLSFSRVLEIDRETGEIVWEYQDRTPLNFYGCFISGAQRLPNGNTLICEGPSGHFFEVTPDKELVWEYINPFFYQAALKPLGYTNYAFRAIRYAPDYPGLKGKDLDPQRYAWLNHVYSSEGFK